MNNSRKYYYPSTYLTINERVISYRRKSSDIVFESSKPIKWGFRPYVLSDASTGYTFFLSVIFFVPKQKLSQNWFAVSQSWKICPKHSIFFKKFKKIICKFWDIAKKFWDSELFFFFMCNFFLGH